MKQNQDWTTPDAVDALLDQWRRERPDLDLAAMGTIGRLGRLTIIVTRRIEETLEAHGLSIADFDVLAALRRAGTPFEVKPTDLARTLMLSPAGITGRLDRLEQAGHVERRMDPEDRRSYLVRLSPSGLDLIDAAVTAHVANEERLLSVLNGEDRDLLDAVLRRLLYGVQRLD